METIAILYLMFKEWLAKVFGSGIHFDGINPHGDSYTEDEK